MGLMGPSIILYMIIDSFGVVSKDIAIGVQSVIVVIQRSFTLFRLEFIMQMGC